MWKKDNSVKPTDWRASGTRTKVLIEHHDPAISHAVSNLLIDAGFDTSTCDGPSGHRVCPLVHDGVCPRADQADLVIFGLELSDEDDRAVLEKLKVHAAGRPIVVEATQRRAALYKNEVKGCAVVGRPMNRATLLDAIESVLRE